MLECYTQKTVRAKNRHICSLCGGPIEAGEKYVTYNGKTSYGWFYFKYHLTCQNIINAFMEENDETEYDYAVINEWLFDAKCHECDKHNRKAGDWECYNFSIPIACPKIRKHFEDAEEGNP